MFSYSDVTKPLLFKNHVTWRILLDVHDILREGFDRSPKVQWSYRKSARGIVRLLKIKLIVLQTRKTSTFVWAWRLEYLWGVCEWFFLIPTWGFQLSVAFCCGFENVKFFRPGYRVWLFSANTIKAYLETKLPAGFFAGQINGTTGYEEAAAKDWWLE
jgi:tRNA uridine 5-carboxymethylaminomethyl modification enzyme